MKSTTMIGIDDMALYIPKLYLPIETLAKERNIEYVKLNKGLGLTQMAIPDVHEDAATMAANAVAELIDKNDLNPNDIGRIYLGTESALDGAKPTATYVVQMLQQKYAPTYGAQCFLHCDVVDLTFACVGGIDALHNTLDWVKGDKDRMGIVVTSDFAKYELASSGEYTQGAGAVAMLIKHEPRLLAISDPVGVGMQSEHDFYKPLRSFSKQQIVEEILCLAGVTTDAKSIVQQLNNSLNVKGLMDDNDEVLTFHKETPIFDGPYSNLTYQNRIREAYEHFRAQAVGKNKMEESESILHRWERLIFHLPYAFHGKRIFSEIYMLEKKRLGEWNDFAAANELIEPISSDSEDEKSYQKAYANFLRAITKTTAYRDMVSQKLEKAQRASSLIGNMYACSVFLALMSSLAADLEDNVDLENMQLGFFSYGSGSKSKVFEGKVQASWKTVVANFKLSEKLANRTELDYATYEQLHRKRQANSVQSSNGQFGLSKIGKEGVTLGARYYELR